MRVPTLEAVPEELKRIIGQAIDKNSPIVFADFEAVGA